MPIPALVKQLSNWIEKHDVIANLDGQIDAFWNETEEAARNGMEAVREETRAAVKEQEEWLSSDAASEYHISSVRRARELWQGVQVEAERAGSVNA